MKIETEHYLTRLLFTSAALLLLVLFLGLTRVYGEEPRFSGIVESNAATTDAYNGSKEWVMEQYGNFRMDTEVNEVSEIHAAANAIAVADSRNELDSRGELERLYFTVFTDEADIEAGYMRMAFGYGQAFRPTDIFNPPNPLFPDARPRGALGGIVSVYPYEDVKLGFFGADRTNPYAVYDDYNRPLAGFSAEVHRPQFSTQNLYAVQAPEQGEKKHHHRFGQSLKFDLELGFALDMLYTWDGEGGLTTDELEFAFGADYSLLDGDLYLLTQYFFNGDGALAADEELNDLYGDGWTELPLEERYPAEGFSDFYRKHYLFFSATYSLDDYSRLSPSVLYAAEDSSFQPVFKAELEPFQAMVLSVTFRMPLDPAAFGGEEHGELGPAHSGYNTSVSGKASLRF